MTDRSPARDEDAALAGEYVLGLLDAAGRATVERRMKADPALAAEVAVWERRLSGLDASFAEVPAPNLMPAIEARLFGRTDAGRRARRSALRGWWARFAGGLVAAGGLAVLLLSVVPPPQGSGGPAVVATLAAPGQALAFEARYDLAAGELVVTRSAGGAAAAGQVHELWLITGGAAPVPLGLIEASDLRIPLPAPPPGAVLAVSLEPAGGSATGAPTGPVLVTGTVAAP